jgi:two-component system, NtrC family, nitrogen regulation sensor histidine kinase NtrY
MEESQRVVRPGLPEAPPRTLGILGPVAVLTALASALATFLVLAGLTPILPTH